ncbi:ZIP family metal transporter [Candidatus Nomurabacteria bacterium]|nr:ZIP family metal transporter [Candidatus Nomurabacteria bacterium]
MWLYAIISTLIVSAISLVGIFTLSLKAEKLERFLFVLVSFSAGTLLGDAFLHLIPEIAETCSFDLLVSFGILAGIGVMLFLEKVIHWHHCHSPSKHKSHAFAKMNLIGDALHNFLDGLVIGAAYTVSIPIGIATTIAVILHEIPQEIGDFGVLLQGGYKKGQALLLNFFIGLFALLGTVLALSLSKWSEDASHALVPFAAGTFIYIALADLFPEIHKETKLGKSLLQLIAFVFGIGVMALLLLNE